MISYAVDVLVILLLFAVFGASHSYLASVHFKEKLKKEMPGIMPFYRLLYNIIALFSLYLIYELSPKPGLIIYDLKYPYDILMLVPQFIALAGILWSARYFSLMEFSGLSQIKRHFNNETDPEELDEKLSLRIEGPYRYMRHPVYFFSIMFLVLRPVMSLFYLVFILCIIAYFYIGSFYEEKKLNRQFGESYRKYSDRVPRIVPFRIFSSYKE